MWNSLLLQSEKQKPELYLEKQTPTSGDITMWKRPIKTKSLRVSARAPVSATAYGYLPHDPPVSQIKCSISRSCPVPEQKEVPKDVAMICQECQRV